MKRPKSSLSARDPRELFNNFRTNTHRWIPPQFANDVQNEKDGLAGELSVLLCLRKPV